jgi:hypothetical protein
MKIKLTVTLLLFIVSITISISQAYSQPNSLDVVKKTLAQQVQNPVSSLISVPFQNNTNYELGDHGQAQNVLNIQPVLPFSFTKKLNMIPRIIFPIITQPDLVKGNGTTNGVGDINASFFFSPKKSTKVTWGVGPVLSIPTGTSPNISNGKWCIGPTAVALIMPDQWVIGGLVNNIWSFTGQGNMPDVNAFLFQPFINYNLPEQWYFSFSPIITANWEAASGQEWIVPLGLSVGKIFKIKDQPMNVSVGAFGNVVKPDIGPGWTSRIQIAFLFPK